MASTAPYLISFANQITGNRFAFQRKGNARRTMSGKQKCEMDMIRGMRGHQFWRLPVISVADTDNMNLSLLSFSPTLRRLFNQFVGTKWDDIRNFVEVQKKKTTMNYVQMLKSEALSEHRLENTNQPTRPKQMKGMERVFNRFRFRWISCEYACVEHALNSQWSNGEQRQLQRWEQQREKGGHDELCEAEWSCGCGAYTRCALVYASACLRVCVWVCVCVWLMTGHK